MLIYPNCNKTMLTNESGHFSKINNNIVLDDNFNPKSFTQVEINNFSFASVEKMIEFIYTGETNLSEIPPKGLLEILQLSDEFLIESLQRISEKKLLNMLKVDNVCEILIICEKLKLKELKLHCLKYLIK